MTSELLIFLTLSSTYGFRIDQSNELFSLEGLPIKVDPSEHVEAGYKIIQSIAEDQAPSPYDSLGDVVSNDLPSFMTEKTQGNFDLSATKSISKLIDDPYNPTWNEDEIGKTFILRSLIENEKSRQRSPYSPLLF
ncbi:hypothetical protein Aperf_G00000105979 [Anoplocephala perfoliata]